MRLLYRMFPGRLQRHTEQLLCGERVEDVYAKIRPVWARASVVYRGLVGYGAELTLEYAILEGFLLRWRSLATPVLTTGLRDPSDVVAAYCIVGLGMIGVAVEPTEVADRTRRIAWGFCSMTGHSTLSEFAAFSGHSSPVGVR